MSAVRGTGRGMTRSKIVNLDEILGLRAAARKEGKTVVQCHGVFDFLHPGHIRLLEESKSLGEVLVVTVTADPYVKKGIGTPVFPEAVRMASIAALACVDYVVLDRNSDACEVIRLLQPDIYVKGGEYSGQEVNPATPLGREKVTLDLVGGHLHFVREEMCWHSSFLLRGHTAACSGHVQEPFKHAEAGGLSRLLTQALDLLASLRVFVVGDSFLERCWYSSAMGSQQHSRTLPVRVHGSELFFAGALAVGGTIAKVCCKGAVLTVLGSCDEREGFWRQGIITGLLNGGLELCLVPQPDGATFVRTTFAEGMTGETLFTYYQDESEPLSVETEREVIETIEARASGFDLTLVIDCGLGVMTPSVVNAVERCAKRVAVLILPNGSQEECNKVTKYRRVHCLCVSERELRLAWQDRDSPAGELLERCAWQLGASAVFLRRSNGDGRIWREGRLWDIPRLTETAALRVRDSETYGALAATCSAVGDLPTDVVACLASFAESIACTTATRQERITRDVLERYGRSLVG